MERNFTNTTIGSKKGTTRHFTWKLFSLLALFLFSYNTSQATTLLDIVVTSTDVSCPGANDGTATVTPFNAWDPITYSWSNGETTPTITGLAPGFYEVTVIDGDGSIDIGSTYVEEGDGLDLFLSASYETCVGSNDGTASVNASGGSGALSYLWSTGETFVVASGLSAGTYSVTVTDSNGCSAEGSIDVELSPEGVWLMISSTDSDCGLDNGTAHVSVMAGTAPFSITWSNGQTGTDISGLSPGTYTVSVTDANGCFNSETVVISSDSDLNLSISGVDANCGASNGSATVTVVGGTSPFTYSWSTGGNTTTITGLSAGTYSVTVADATGCSNVISVEIEEESGIDVDANSTDADCSQNDGSASASVNGGTAPYSYSWSNGGNTSTITGLAPGSYTVTATDANGCQDTETVIVEGADPDGGMISTNDDLQICAGDGVDDLVNVTLSGNTGANSRWVLTDPSGNIIGFATGSPFNFEGAGAGNCVIWHLSYEDGLSGLTIGNNVAQLQGCYNFSNSITVVRTDPDGGMISTNDDTSVCVGDGNDDFIDVIRTGATGAIQAWVITDQLGNILGLPIAPPFNFEGAGPGTCLIWSISYEPGLTGLMANANVSDLNGCYELSSNSITVIRNEVPTVTLSATDVSCAGSDDGSIDSNVSGGSGNYTYSWSNGATTANLSNVGAGTYTLTVTDDNGCTATANALITEPSPLNINTSGSNETCMDSNDGTASATVTGGTSPYTYAWNNSGNTATISGLAPGTYNVTVTDANGCSIVSDDVIIGSDGITSCNAMVTSSYNEGTDISTFGGNDGTASASGSGGTLPYTYAWSNGQTGASASNLSAGTYTVTVTDAGGCSCVSTVTLTDPSKIGNFVWDDENRDGDQDPGELGIGGVTINLTGTTTTGIAVMRTVNTNPDGSYIFDGLLAGNYKVTFEEPSGYAVSPLNAGGDDTLDSDMDPDTGMTSYFDLGTAECNNTIDAGLYQCVSIGDFVFYDGNHDGIQQPWEAGYADALVNLKTVGPDGIYCTQDDEFIDGQTTGNNGRYLFECIEPGTYYIEFVVNSNEYMFSDQDQGNDDELDSDVNSTTGKTDLFTVTEGMPDDLSYDVGIYLICDDFSTGGQIGYDQDICAGEFPDPLVSINMPGGGYGATEFLWLKSTTGGPIGGGSWMEIPNSDSPTYAPPQLYQTTYFIRCARRENCDNFVAESNSVVIVVNTCFGAMIQNLEANVEAAQVRVEWRTSPEDQLFMYHVERSFDGVTFEELGAVNGFGDLQTSNHYSFMDNAPRLGRNLYRVIREDLNTSELITSDNVEVMFSTDNNRFFVYPNPATTELFVESFQTMNDNASLELYDATGKLLDIVEVDYTLGKAQFDFKNYAAGLYFVKVHYEDKDDIDVIKIIKE